MKTLSILTFVGAAGLRSLCAAPQMAESAAEFFASGDFDGDSRMDTVIIDKSAGVMRIGYQTAPETWTWVPARPAGALPVTAAAVGRLLDNARDAIAVTASAANRVLVHPAENVATASPPVALYDLVGPDALAPVPLPGSGGLAGRDQILAGSVIDPNAAPYAVAGFEGSAGVMFITTENAPLRRGQPMRLKTGSPWQAAFLADTAASTELRVYDGGAPGITNSLTSTGVPAGTHYAAANFDVASPLAQMILWTPGTPALRVRPVTEPAVGTFDTGPEIAHALSGNIAQIIILDDPAGPRLLVIFNDGASAGVFTFNGSAAPVLVTTLAPAAGERFRAGALTGGGGFVLSSSPAASTRSQTFRPYRRATANSYTPLASASLPNVITNSGRANVLLFSDPPFVTDGARPLAALHAGDWTRSISIAGGSVSAVAEMFGGTSTGLDNPVPVNLGAAMPGADEVLANQFEPWLSVSSLRPVYDTPDIEPAISPMPGNFDAAQRLSFSAPAGVSVFFRIGAGAWQAWAGNPPWLTESATVHYYGVDGLLRTSALRSAGYTFAMDGPFLDSDHDGVPDFVELANGLNPLGGPDSDGDTWSDDTELLAGTDPTNAADPVRPAPPAILPMPPRAANTGVNLTATLRSWRGGGPDLTLFPQPGTRVDAIDTAGTLMATRIVPGMIPATDTAVIENLAVPRGTRFISLTTAPSWNREDGMAVVMYASQSIAIVPAPPPPPPLIIGYVPGGGPPAVEAAAWVAALATAEAAQVPREVAATLSPVDSLVALLVEKKIDDILIGRGANAAVRFSMFDTGLTDAGARRATPAQIEALELPGPANEPAWRMEQIHSLIDLAVKATPGSADVQALRQLAGDIFEQFDSVWQPASDLDPNGTTAGFPAPIDLLRSTVRGVALPQGYLDVTTLTGAEISAAQAAIVSLLALPAPRPETTVTLTARPDSWRADCTVFDNGATPVALVEHDGTPWRFQGSVALPPGALVQVRGFTDLPPPPPACAASTLEVITAAVQTLPGGPVADSDGDGLGDEWELVFFGSLTQSGGGDFDSDGATNAAELAAGTDPAGRSSGGPGPLFQPLPVPDPEITLSADGTVQLTWECSEECRKNLRYSLECDPHLEGAWVVRSTSPEFLPDERMRFTIIPESPGRCFFRIRVTQP